MRGELHGGYQDNTNPSLRPTTQFRERKKHCCQRKVIICQSLRDCRDRNNNQTQKKRVFYEIKTFHILLREKNSLWVSVSEQWKLLPNKKRKLQSQGVDAEASWHVCVSRSLGRSCAFLPDYTNCNNTEGEMMSLLLWKRKMSVFLFL